MSGIPDCWTSLPDGSEMECEAPGPSPVVYQDSIQNIIQNIIRRVDRLTVCCGHVAPHLTIIYFNCSDADLRVVPVLSYCCCAFVIYRYIV